MGTSVLQPQDLRLSWEDNPKLSTKQTDTLISALWDHKQSTPLSYAMSTRLTQQNCKRINGCCLKLLCLWQLVMAAIENTRGKFWLDARCCGLYLFDCWIFMYPHKYFWVLLWDRSKFLENSWIFSSLVIFFFRVEIEHLYSRANLALLLRSCLSGHAGYVFCMTRVCHSDWGEQDNSQPCLNSGNCLLYCFLVVLFLVVFVHTCSVKYSVKYSRGLPATSLPPECSDALSLFAALTSPFSAPQILAALVSLNCTLCFPRSGWKLMKLQGSPFFL